MNSAIVYDTFQGPIGLAVANHVPDIAPTGAAWAPASQHKFSPIGGIEPGFVGVFSNSNLPIGDLGSRIANVQFDATINAQNTGVLLYFTTIQFFIDDGLSSSASMTAQLLDAGAQGNIEFFINDGGGTQSVGSAPFNYGINTLRMTLDTFSRTYNCFLNSVLIISGTWPIAINPNIQHAAINLIDTYSAGAPTTARKWLNMRALYDLYSLETIAYNGPSPLANFSQLFDPFGILQGK